VNQLPYISGPNLIKLLGTLKFCKIRPRSRYYVRTSPAAFKRDIASTYVFSYMRLTVPSETDMI